MQRLIEQDQFSGWLLEKYPQAHGVRTDKALYDYVVALKNQHLRHAAPLSRVQFDGKLAHLERALGTHTSIARVQGGKLKTKRELRIAALFKATPEAFLRMIVVHELAHLRVMAHDKTFYQLCRHMEPEYDQLEFELRAYLTHLALTGQALWAEKIRPTTGQPAAFRPTSAT